MQEKQIMEPWDQAECRVRIPRIRGTIGPSNNHQDINSPGKNDLKKENSNI